MSDTTDAREHVADALATELDRRGVTTRLIEDIDVSVLVPDDHRIHPIWINARYIRVRTGPGMYAVEAYPLDGALDTLADRITHTAREQTGADS